MRVFIPELQAFASCNQGDFVQQSGRCFRITFNIIGKKFPQSGRFTNVFVRTWKDSFIFRELSAESGRVGSSVTMLDCSRISTK